MIRLPARREVLRDLPNLAMTLALASVGAGLFTLLGLPVAQISGSMVVVAVATIAGAPLVVPTWLRSIAFFLLGMNIGAAVTPETITGIGTWPGSILILVIGLPITVAACAAPLVLWRGWKRDDALLACVPGALSMILVIADATKADVPRIAMVQALRVVILATILPPLIAVSVDMPEVALQPEHALIGPVDLVLLVASGLLAMVILRLMRFPAVALLGPMIASAALHGAGVVSSVAPQPVLIVAFIVLGAVIGVRFSGVGWKQFRAGLFDALMVFAIGFALAVLSALVVTWWLDFGFAQTMMSFSPGAFEVMVVMAFVLGADAAYVGAHHTIRVLVLMVLAPMVFRRKTPPKEVSVRDP